MFGAYFHILGNTLISCCYRIVWYQLSHLTLDKNTDMHIYQDGKQFLSMFLLTLFIINFSAISLANIAMNGHNNIVLSK